MKSDDPYMHGLDLSKVAIRKVARCVICNREFEDTERLGDAPTIGDFICDDCL